ncbi:hypothetical protein OAB91_00630 [Alphaproteobacteria bacterium]|nr:hypothetical protein [Alphaproteobacteria bacterium]
MYKKSFRLLSVDKPENILSTEILDIARRPVAKYRDFLKITSSENRRRVFSFKNMEVIKY